MPKIPKVLTIAGSDSGGGAGIQADLKTFSAFNVHGCCAITSVTAQNTKEVTKIQDISGEMIVAQVDAVIDDIGADSVKIGMLSSQEIIKAVAGVLKKHRLKNIVLDPVMVSASGAKLLQDNAIKTLKKDLIPLASIVTPNIPEAEVLAGFKINSLADIKKAAKEIFNMGPKSVLIKGGHVQIKKGKVCDYFYDGKTELIVENSKINKEGHGTGCTLSSAIAANLALGFDKLDSVKKSIEYVHKALEKGYKVGSRNYVLKHD
ncbi:MAG TPA: bifunctional hydroxymethylpyrimidine kinase/phosphomethylpyrimidine kinase [Candidatus Nanoarchaeia archaeon]|nr:bifunctional hydroxymethylpyrimidine kinase/phosphomethylpyrimidine kinase [Candidatus Nanoarchaeia archaeon]